MRWFDVAELIIRQRRGRSGSGAPVFMAHWSGDVLCRRCFHAAVEGEKEWALSFQHKQVIILTIGLFETMMLLKNPPSGG